MLRENDLISQSEMREKASTSESVYNVHVDNIIKQIQARAENGNFNHTYEKLPQTFSKRVVKWLTSKGYEIGWVKGTWYKASKEVDILIMWGNK